MTFSWNGRFILRRVEEDDPRHHRVYVHSDKAEDITDAYTRVSADHALAAKNKFEADRFDPGYAWQVSVGSGPTVAMAVFVLRSRS